MANRPDRLGRAALLTLLIEKLRENDSWCGETHIQKAVYLTQIIAGIPLGYEFILYKHGPFSFDLRDELTALRADMMVDLEIKWPYGPKIVPTEQSKYIQSHYPKTLQKYESRIEFVASKLGAKDVVDLERLGTAVYVARRWPDDVSVDARARRIVTLKPHIAPTDAYDAIREADKLSEEARKAFPS